MRWVAPIVDSLCGVVHTVGEPLLEVDVISFDTGRTAVSACCSALKPVIIRICMAPGYDSAISSQ
jgi:hypothetical protein